MGLSGKHVLLGVTGGIAAYKAAELTRLLLKGNATVQIVMSEAALRFVGAATFQALSGRPVFSDPWDGRIANNMAHIELSRQADLMLVAPASADFIARVVHGRADDLLTALVLARDCPLMVAPAMNRQMWENPATRRNVEQLIADGIVLLGPDQGEQACGETGVGRMIEPEEIVEALSGYFTEKTMAGKNVLITAGPTFEAIDAVRGLTNLSSGKMGFALARAACEAGARVTLVTGPVSLPTPYGVTRIDVVSGQQMCDAVLARAAEADVFISVAAVADYRVANPASRKIKKDGEPPRIELVLNPDILATVASLPKPPFCVGFAAESENLEQYAADKMRRKKVPFLVANLIEHGFGGDDNRVVVFDASGMQPLPSTNKLDLARMLIERIARAADFI